MLFNAILSVVGKQEESSVLNFLCCRTFIRFHKITV